MISLEIYKVQKLYIRSSVVQTYQNGFGFKLYAILFINYMVATSDNLIKSEKELSSILLLNTGDQIQRIIFVNC